uniref:non-specific serine/threonine protein kinase n=2 Tax=Cajanus cajan TaxID=3821 RepID=A0A151T830_CAJCA|nr:Serine/threonine-protein kinase-like protein At5g23170 family [Cajanus cajan]
MEEFDYEEIVKATENFNPRKMIGKGSHGMVYKGVVLKDNIKRLVAIKKPSQGLQSLHDNSKLENEIRVLSSLGQNPNVVNLLGTTSTSYEQKVIVMDLMPNGTLHDMLHVNKTPPTWHKRVEIAMQIARSVQFLHEGKPVVIHRDIKSSNILFDSQWNAKLADFGLAVKGVDSVSQPAGTIGYLDPCYTTPDKLSTKNDMFSLGVVLLEIVSGRKAMDVCKTPASVVEWAIGLMEEHVTMKICDTRVAVPSNMVGTISQLVRCAARCVSENEDERPSARDVVLGMESCLVEGVRFLPLWRCVLVWLRKKKRKLIMSIGANRQRRIRCIAQEEEEEEEGEGDAAVSMTIKQVLAESDSIR